ncbi:MAG: hypothetical protein K9N07_08800 [Candidatus Cloacimonetes bacterium]|nr:hypothetical protein [Candidatus Cloacimonadota bacterium]
MQREKIYIERIKKFSELLKTKQYTKIADLKAGYVYDNKVPIPYDVAIYKEYKPIKLNEKWGDLWGCAWFKFFGKVPKSTSGKEIGAIINVDGEACWWKNGIPYQGITNKIHWYLGSSKEYLPLFKKCQGGETIDLLLEAGANSLFGAGEDDFNLKKMDIVEVNNKVIKLSYDLDVLISLFQILPKKTPRRNKIIFGLNEVCNVWNDGNGIG